jgi:hypothetical protein
MVRHQEQWAQKKVSQRVAKVQSLREERSRQTPVTLIDFLNRDFFANQPQIRPEVYATDRFYSDYAFAAATCPFLYRVQPLYDSEKAAKATGCLHSIVPAVALASEAKRNRRHDLMQEASQHYGRTLRRLSKCLANPDDAKNDATLLTIFLLGLYEVSGTLL